MEREKSINERRIELIIYLIFIVGIIGHADTEIRPLMLKITPLTMLLAGFLAAYEPLRKNKRLIVWCVFTYFITLTLEIIGTNTGLIFGNYHYNSTLGLKIMNTPYIIGFNWVILILGASSVAALMIKNNLMRFFIASCLTVGVDFFLEQLAAKLNYWTWVGASVPMYNYVSWFLITFFAATALGVLIKKFYHKNFVHFFIGQALFIIISDLIIK